ncbi:hypothetical protein EAF04_004958 [Stromatinia cepivora]|nr:hypothetical protein EAF04_004958 [Stromatinia cepivora]
MELIEPNPYLGFGAILPTYTLIIGESCPKLRKLTLHQSHDLGRWSSDLQKPDDMSSEDMIDNIVKDAALRLPSLRELQLGAYFNVPDAPRELRDRDCRTEWGKSLQWMKFVDERKRDQQPQVDIENNMLIDRTGVRSGSGNRYEDSVEHVRHGRYGTSNCNWSFTRCPSQATSSHTGELYRLGRNERDQYGFLPKTTDRVWRCQDAHGGIRDPIGNILNVAVKIDPRGAPHTISPSKLEMEAEVLRTTDSRLY